MGKPDLLKVLEHYGAQVQPHRTSQLIRCVVHDEDRASMSVNLSKGLVNCMACGFAGDVYSIVMKKEGLPYGAAVQRSAEIAGVPPVDQSGRVDRRRHGGGFRPRVRRGLRD